MHVLSKQLHELRERQLVYDGQAYVINIVYHQHQPTVHH